MEKICKWCDKSINFENPRSFGAHLTNCKSNPNKIKRDLESVKKKTHSLDCECGKIYTIYVTDYQFNIGNYTKFCSMGCSNKRILSKSTKEKISKSLKLSIGVIHNRTCPNCKIEFVAKMKKNKFCSRSCATKFRMNSGQSSMMGKKSVHSQKRRSKNESLFSEYCKSNFTKVLTNEPIFNGWDADVIIEDIKVAILWNGIWHYKQIVENRDMEKVNRRDSLKIKEIESCGYTPYTIKDMGGFSEEKVKIEWEIFNIWLKNRNTKII